MNAVTARSGSQPGRAVWAGGRVTTDGSRVGRSPDVSCQRRVGSVVVVETASASPWSPSPSHAGRHSTQHHFSRDLLHPSHRTSVHGRLFRPL